MKRTLLKTAALGLILGLGESDVLAQTEKGRALIGGTIGFNSN